MKHSKGKRNRVRSHHALQKTSYVKCEHCVQEKLSHIVCYNCGYYNGRQVIDVLAKLDKKQRRNKEKELHRHEEEAVSKEKETAKV